MTDSPLSELVAAVSEGLGRPYHFWTLIVVVVAIAGAQLVSGLVRARTQDRLDRQRRAVNTTVDALQFSIPRACAGLPFRWLARQSSGWERPACV